MGDTTEKVQDMVTWGMVIADSCAPTIKKTSTLISWYVDSSAAGIPESY